jgi:hypothetical protein
MNKLGPSKRPRKNSYSFTPPEDFEDWNEEEMNMSEAKRELAYFKEHYYDDIPVKKATETPIIFTMNSDWLCIRFATKPVAALVQDQLKAHFVFGRFKHTETIFDEQDGFTITKRTGNAKGGTSCSLGTLFFLKKGNKVIAKSL